MVFLLLKLSQILRYMVDQSTSISLSQPPRSIMLKSQDLHYQDIKVNLETTSKSWQVVLLHSTLSTPTMFRMLHHLHRKSSLLLITLLSGISLLVESSLTLLQVNSSMRFASSWTLTSQVSSHPSLKLVQSMSKMVDHSLPQDLLLSDLVKRRPVFWLGQTPLFLVKLKPNSSTPLPTLMVLDTLQFQDLP